MILFAQKFKMSLFILSSTYSMLVGRVFFFFGQNERDTENYNTLIYFMFAQLYREHWPHTVLHTSFRLHSKIVDFTENSTKYFISDGCDKCMSCVCVCGYECANKVILTFN